MSPLELLAPEAPDTTPFSVRLAERRLAVRAAARAERRAQERRAHERRNASNLDWLRAVRLTGGTGYDVNLIDLSEGGALLEVNTPLRPGLILTLEMSGPGLEAAVPLEVLRCYIASLRGETATYRGAVAFAHLIQLPGKPARESGAADFVGTAAALAHLLDRCTSSRQSGASGVSLERRQVLHVLDALRTRASTRGSDLLSRYASDLLAAILPALHGEAPRDVAVEALEQRLHALPRRWQSLLEPTVGRLSSLIEHCATTADTAESHVSDLAPPIVWNGGPAAPAVSAAPPIALSAPEGQVDSALQKIVVRYADGKTLKGYTQDFHPSRTQFSLWPSVDATPKKRTVVDVSRLKAVFFVRDFNGNPGRQEGKALPVTAQGRRVEVTFTDGENIAGTTLSYQPDGQGFFVSPADPATNNLRIYVVAKAVQRVRFL